MAGFVLNDGHYWRSVLRFSGPFVLVFDVIDYFVNRATTGVGLSLPLWPKVAISILAIFLLPLLPFRQPGNGRRSSS